MRRQRLLRTSSTQSLCIFCACRLTGDLPTVASRPLFTQQQRRGLANTNQPFQGFQPAAIPSQGNDIQNPNSPQWTGFDPKSSLSASEQREKAALRQRREAAEQARREEAEHTAAEERARRDVKDRRRWEQDQARLQAHQREQQRAQQRDKQQDAARRTNVANPQALRSEVAPTRGFYNLSLNGSRREEPSSPSIPSGNNSKRPADGEETSKPRNSTQSQQNDRSRRDFNEERSQRPMHSAHPKHDSRSSRDTNEVGPHRQAVGRNGPVKPASKPEMLPERVTTPNFLKSGSARPAPTPEPVASGWGSGATERKALLYGEELPEQKVHEEYGIPGLRDIGYSQNSNIHDTPVEPQSRNGGFGVQNSETRDDSTYTPGYTEHFDTVHTNAQNWSISRPTPPEGTQRPLEASPPPPPGPEPTKHTNPDARSIQDVLSTASGSRFSKQQSNTPWMQEQASVEGQAFGQSDRYRSPPPVERPTEQLDQVERHPVSEPAFGEQRPAYRTHESGKKKPAYRTNGQNGYRVTPFNPNDCSGNHKTADQAPQSNWQHLSRRKPEPASQAPPPPPPVRQSPVYSEEDVDRLFSQHREERMQRAPPPPPPVYSSYRPPVREDRARNTPWLQDGFEPEQAARPPPRPRDAPTVCGRCRQEGHHARECPGQKCNHCGQLGHLSRNCPTSYGRTTGVRSVRLDLPEGERAGPRRTEYSFTPDRQRGDHFEDERPARNSRNGWQRPAREDRGSDDPRQMMMERVLQSESAGEEDEEPEERVLKSRKFRDEEPEKDKKKPGRRSRDEEDEDDYNDRRSRRGRRDFDDEEGDSRPSRKSNKNGEKEAQKRAERAAERAAQRAEQRNQIKLPQFISVQNLAQALGVRYEQFVNRLEDLGYDDVFPGKILNTEISGMIAMEYDLEAVYDTGISEEEERDLKARPEVDPQDKDYLPTRPPVVTIMGHVDHGKTTILDYLRKSSVAAGEAGGITQHIGAFSVPLAASGKTVTFLDTPGHAAFLAMRQRGANVTDIVILVVAADDSVKPQTLEAIKHAKAAGVPMIVAVNKIDKEEADVQRVKQDLARHGVEIEDFGGETQVVLVSGKTGQGMDELEEAAVTLSEILDHRAEADGAVEGWVLEATTKKAGRVATVLVRRGTLRQGAVIVAGKTWARVRSLRNEAGVVINEASPGMPVEVDGWRDQPAAGDEVLQAPTEQKATSVVEYRLEKDEREKTAADMEAINEARRLEQAKREREQAKLNSTSSEDPASITTTSSSISSDQDPASTGKQEIPFIIKADVSGSAEAVSAYILSISSPLIGPRVLSSSVGSIHESDIELASAADGHIIAFNLPPNEGMKGQAEARGVKVLENNIIYRVLDDVRAVLEEKLPPVVTQRVLGEAEVAASFEIGIGGRKKMVIAGCKVRNGLVSKGARVRVTRGGEKVYDGLITSLKNVKKDVTEMRKGSECGMGFGDGWEGFETGDQVQTYEERSERRKL